MQSLVSLLLALSLVGKGANIIYCQLSNEFAFLQFTFSFLWTGRVFPGTVSGTKYDLRCNAKNLDLKRIPVPFCRTCYQVYGR